MSQKQFRLFIATLLLCTAALVFAILFLASYVHWSATVQTGQWLNAPAIFPDFVFIIPGMLLLFALHDNKTLNFSLFPACVMCIAKEATASYLR